MITAPGTGTFRALYVDVVAGPPQEVDNVHIAVPFTGDMVTLLTDQDVDDITQIIVDRMVDQHPEYAVHVYRRWVGDNNAGPDVVYEPPS